MIDHKQKEQLVREGLAAARRGQGVILLIGGLYITTMLICDFYKGPNDNNPYKTRAMQAAGVVLGALVWTEVQKDKIRPHLPERNPPPAPR